MHVGDQVKLHIVPEHRALLDLPESVGTIRAIDETPLRPAVLIHFDDLSVYTSMVSEGEVEVMTQPHRPRSSRRRLDEPLRRARADRDAERGDE